MRNAESKSSDGLVRWFEHIARSASFERTRLGKERMPPLQHSCLGISSNRGGGGAAAAQ
jgi:hypothetical protein